MIKSQKKNLDKLFQIAINNRDNECKKCKKQQALNAHHLFSRARMNTRWDLDNGILLCAGCHVFSSLFSAHKTPRAFFRWIEEYKGKKWLDDLENRSQLTAKNLDYNLIRLYLEQEIKKNE